MIDTEDLLEAMVHGVTKEDYDKMTPVQLFQLRNQFMDLLVPILPLITQAKHDAWNEGAQASLDSALNGPVGSNLENPYWVT